MKGDDPKKDESVPETGVVSLRPAQFVSLNKAPAIEMETDENENVSAKPEL